MARILTKESRDELFGHGGLMADVFAPVGKVTNNGEGCILQLKCDPFVD